MEAESPTRFACKWGGIPPHSDTNICTPGDRSLGSYFLESSRRRSPPVIRICTASVIEEMNIRAVRVVFSKYTMTQS